MALDKLTSDMITADAIEGTKIADNAIDSEHYVDGSADNIHLATGIDAAKLTGTLPAIDGASLTGISTGAKGADIASAATVVVGTDGGYFDITGTTGISTQFTVAAGRTFTLQFDGAVIITDNAAITLAGAANFTTAAGDILTFTAVAANTVVQTGYSLVDGGSPVVAGGVSDMSIWRLPSDQAFSAGANTVLTGWGEMTESSSYGYKRIGSAITYSSGIFAFPSTGTWLVDCKLMISFPASTAALYTQGNFEFTNNNSSYTVIGSMKGVPGGTTGYWHGLEQSCSNLISVDDIANDKVRVRHYNSHAGTFQGSNSIHSYMRFYKFSTATT